MKTCFLTLTTILGLSLAACGGKAKPAAETKPAPAAAAPTCAQGEMLHENECLKECSADEDCPPDHDCEQLHLMNDDGTIGPVAGSACTPKAK